MRLAVDQANPSVAFQFRFARDAISGFIPADEAQELILALDDPGVR